MEIARLIQRKNHNLLPKYTITLALLCFAVHPLKAAAQPVIAPVPDWVVEIDFPRLSEEEFRAQSGSFYNLLVDHQVNLEEGAFYFHSAIKILNPEGVQQRSDLNFDYDPSFETLEFHKLVIHRNGEIINKLGEDPIQTFQRETRLEEYMYDGSRTASVNLSDVRVGDIIECAVSLHGRNPAYNGHDFGSATLGSQRPVESAKIRIMVPDGKTLTFRHTHEDTEPDTFRDGKYTIYLWNLEKVEGTHVDNNVPDWYEPYAMVEYTDFASWREVVEWAQPLFDVERPEIDRVRALSEDALSFSDPAVDIMKAVRFVQDEIRYLGLEHGMSAYLPHPPSQVWEQRYGDCKDKSLLLIVLLREIGVEAHPMLVSYRSARFEEEYLHSPGTFNHCVVALEYKDKQYFVDPARSYQGGDLDHLFFPMFRFGLIISPDSEGLSTLPTPYTARMTVKEHYDLDDSGGAALLIHTETEYYEADRQRSYFATNDRSSIQNNFLNFYSALYPDISTAEDVSYTDGTRDSDNVFVYDESYRIENIWKQSVEDTQMFYAKFYALQLEHMVDWDTSPNRTMPYQVGQVDFRHEIILEPPQHWPITEEDLTIAGDGFKYRHSVFRQNESIKIVREYQRTRGDIEADAVTDFIEKHDRIRANLSYVLTRKVSSDDPGGGIAWIMMILPLVFAAGAFGAAARLYSRYDPEPRLQGLEPGAGPSGTGGWLLLPALGLIWTPIRFTADLPDLLVCFDRDILSFDLAFGTVLCMEALFGMVFFVYWGLLIVLFFKKRSSFPTLYSVYLASYFCFAAVDAILVDLTVPDPFTGPGTELNSYDILKPLTVAAIWIPYFHVSERVKRTFVERSPAAGRQPVPSTESLVEP